MSKPLFDGYQYQDRAKELVEQFTKRQAMDFKTLRLPTEAEWNKQREVMSRPQQIEFLAKRLRLLNCFQWGQPGGVSYEDAQYDEPRGDDDGQRKQVINPYSQLGAMKLEIRDLPALVPFLADENYLPTYSYWRDFHPGRTLHRVNWLVADLVNDAAKRDLADLRTWQQLDEAERKAHLEKISQWVAANAHLTRSQLLLETAGTAKEYREFARAAGELSQDKNLDAMPILMRRLEEFADHRDDVLEMCYVLAPDRAVEAARQHLKSTDTGTRFWSAMILLNAGDQKKLEGLAEMRAVLEKDDREDYAPRAFEQLLALKNEEAVKVACGVLAMKYRPYHHNRGPMIHRLLLAGRPDALEYVLKALASDEKSSSSSGTYEGQQVSRENTVGDAMGSMICEWRTDKVSYPTLAPDDLRAAERQKLAAWIKEQFELIKAGKPSAISGTPRRLHVSEWRVDAP